MMMRSSRSRLLAAAAALALLIGVAGLILWSSNASRTTATPEPVSTLNLETHATPEAQVTPAAGLQTETPLVEIPLAGPAARSEAEISGLGWYSETLVLLPQYPQRMSTNPGGSLLLIPRKEFLDFLDGQQSGPLLPDQIPLDTGGIEERIPGFEGFEAIVFAGERFFVTIEAEAGGKMMGYLAAGEFSPDLSAARLDPASLTPNPPQLNRSNQSDEALLIAGNTLLSFYEVNGAGLNPDPHATGFGLDLQPAGAQTLPALEYRLTDATTPDSQGIFWVSNYFFPGDSDMKPASDPLRGNLEPGATHATSEIVERLVAFQLTTTGIELAGLPPVWLELRPDGEARNWEGLVVLPGRGFLLVTDKYPATIIAFAAYPFSGATP